MGKILKAISKWCFKKKLATHFTPIKVGPSCTDYNYTANYWL